MSSGNIEWKKMKELVLQRLHAKYDALSKEERQRTVLHMQDPETMESITLSPDDQITEVQSLSDIGKKIVVAQIQLISTLQP